LRTSRFKGHITDVGDHQQICMGLLAHVIGTVAGKVAYPYVVLKLRMNTAEWLQLLKQAAEVEGVSKVTVGSGIRYDLLMCDPDITSVARFDCQSYQRPTQIAPEHTSPNVLRAMRKMPLVDLKQFLAFFRQLTAQQGKEQYPLPY